MAEEASSSYRGHAADVPRPPLKFTFQAGQVEQPRQGGKHAKPHKHTSPFRKPPEDKPFPSFPASPAPAMNGMHTGSAATSGNAVPASSSTPSPTLPRSLESAFNGMHAGMAAKSGSAGQGAAADMAAQLPPRFTSAVNISEGSAAASAEAQHANPYTAARTGPRTARRRANLRTPGGGVGTPGGASPFLREGSPMDWSPSFPEPAAPKPADGGHGNGVSRSKHDSPAGLAAEHLSSKDDELDGLHADLAASSLSGDGNKQQAQLNAAFSSGFNLGSRTDSQTGQPPAQPAADTAAASKNMPADIPGASAAHSAPPSSASHTAHSSTATGQPDANGTSEHDLGKQELGEELAAKFAELTAQWKARPDAPSAGQPGQSGQSQSAASQAAAAMPGTGSIGGESAGGRSLSDDSSADSGLPRGVLHHGSTRSPAKGHRARISPLSQAAKQMKEARHHIRVDTRPGMTLKDFQAAAKAHASRRSKAGSARMHVDQRTASRTASQAAEPVAATGQANGFQHASEMHPSASDKGQAWRSYQSSQTEAPQENSHAEGSSTHQAASAGNPAGRSRPATADLDEYLSRQHDASSNAPADSAKASEPSASAANAPSVPAQKLRPSSAGHTSHAATFSAAQPSHAKPQEDVSDVSASSIPADTSAEAIHAAEQNEQVDPSRPSAPGTVPVRQTDAGTSSFTVAFGQQAASEGGQSEPQPGSAVPGRTQGTPPSHRRVSFAEPPAAEASAAGTAQAKAQRSPKRSTAQTFRPGSPAPIFMFSSPATKPFQQPSESSTSAASFTFGAAPTTEMPRQHPTAQSSSSAWPNAGFQQPQPNFTASASQAWHAGYSSAGPAGQHVSGGSAPSWPQPGASFMQAQPTSFPGFNAQTAQQAQAPAQREPVFTFGQQPEAQRAVPGGPAAQQQPDPGSARARGFTFGLGSQNVPPTQNSARPLKTRSARHAAKAPTPHAAKHQPPAAAAQNGPAYSQPGPRMSIPVRCSNHFESPMQGTPAASRQPAPAADAAHRSPEQDVERLRQRGNDAFQRGNYNRAADLYNRAVKQQVQLGVTEGLGKLYSNLAACFLQQEHFSKAIQACQLALQAEPGFHKASIRMATCQMRLGDAAAARAALEADPRLQAHADVAAKLAEIKAHGSRISVAISAADSAQSTSAAEAALTQVDALLQPDQAPGSQDLRRLKHQLQLQLSRFEDAAGACQPRRFPSGMAPPDWHWWLAVQAAFHSGEVSHAVDLLSTQIAAVSPWGASPPGIAIGAWKGATDGAGQQLGTGHAREILGSMQRMLELKEAGNSALKASQAQQAVEHYSKALQLEHPPSKPFAAVLHANRAAARQSLGQHAEAIADCLRATALKPDYAKAHSRLAALLADLKHNNRAVDVLERLEGLVKGLPLEAADVARRLRDARLSAKFDAVDHYKLLGVDRSVSSEDVRRAYKKSALQLHPDKALTQCRFSLRLGDQGLELCSRSETEQRVRDNADWLFKCIAEAHTILTDPTERQELDSGLARQERHQRARAGSSYRPPPRRPAQSPYGSYGSKSYGYHRYNGEPEGPSWGDYDDDYVPYSSSRWNYY